MIGVNGDIFFYANPEMNFPDVSFIGVTFNMKEFAQSGISKRFYAYQKFLVMNKLLYYNFFTCTQMYHITE